MGIADPVALLNRLCDESSESTWLEFKENRSDPEMLGRWVSACANAAILSGRDRGFLIFGVQNDSREKVGTSVRLKALKKGGENFENWLSRTIEPRLMFELLDFEHEGKNFAIISIETSYERPVRFSGTEYIRIGENVRKLAEFPEHERSLWLATGRRRFEDATALPNVKAEEVMKLLDFGAYYRLTKEPVPTERNEAFRRFCALGFLKDNLQDRYDITNLGAILFAADLDTFPSVQRKSVRVIRYAGRDKRKALGETEGKKGYAVGFQGLLTHVKSILPYDESYEAGLRSEHSIYPDTAIREVIANALIHQDFIITGSAPVIEVYQDRLEVTNPGNSLIELDRIIDERRSRNEKLAQAMRALGICEERGGGLDKALIEIEEMNLPAPDFHSSENSMRVVLLGPRSFKQLSKTEKLRAGFYHCILRWIAADPMSNSSLRERFRLEDSEYQTASAIISELTKMERIKPADVNQGNRNARYIPYFA